MLSAVLYLRTFGLSCGLAAIRIASAVNKQRVVFEAVRHLLRRTNPFLRRSAELYGVGACPANPLIGSPRMTFP